MEKVSQNFENNPKYVAQEIAKIVGVMISSLKYESRPNAYRSLRDKVQDLNVIELSNKKTPGGSSIGVSISLIKNILNGKDPYFIRSVVAYLVRYLP
tara:strand:- start:449 stop:739 length:291 start_codon:yes stop_codon:yes gene_type:complete